MSLREMARRVDVSPSFISQVELGKTMPSVGTLYSIASELGVSLDDLMPSAQPASGIESPPRPGSGLMAAPEPGAPATPATLAAPADAGLPAADRLPPGAAAAMPESFARVLSAVAETNSPVQRADRRHELRIGGAIWGRLTADHDPANDFLHVTYKPGGESCPTDRMIHHRGFEYGYIVTGQLHVQVGFVHYDLDPGDSISFDSATPHRLSNPFGVESQSIWLVVGRGGTPVL
jgi:transcriptional regulator with XRE-family HTH domain